MGGAGGRAGSGRSGDGAGALVWIGGAL